MTLWLEILNCTGHFFAITNFPTSHRPTLTK